MDSKTLELISSLSPYTLTIVAVIVLWRQNQNAASGQAGRITALEARADAHADQYRELAVMVTVALT